MKWLYFNLVFRRSSTIMWRHLERRWFVQSSGLGMSWTLKVNLGSPIAKASSLCYKPNHKSTYFYLSWISSPALWFYDILRIVHSSSPPSCYFLCIYFFVFFFNFLPESSWIFIFIINNFFFHHLYVFLCFLTISISLSAISVIIVSNVLFSKALRHWSQQSLNCHRRSCAL